jgi:thymidylate synthase (FAD)
MQKREISVHLIARTTTIDEAVRKWLEELGVSEESVDRILDDTKTQAEKLIECAGRRCYKSFEPGLNPNVTKIRLDIAEYIDNILKVGHGSVIEHANFTFAIENVSRVFTGEMNRHRAGMAISEGSMRYIRYEDIPYCEPTSIRPADDDEVSIAAKKAETRKVFEEAFTDAEKHYTRLLNIWASELDEKSQFKAKKEITSMMRRIIPMGVCTGGIWSGNLRALRHIFNMRCAPAAEEEILLVANKMLALMQQAEPTFFADFHLVEGYWKPKYQKV